MANFAKWEDLHDYNRKLMEDDWNEGSNYVLKLKYKAAGGNVSITNLMTKLFYIGPCKHYKSWTRTS